MRVLLYLPNHGGHRYPYLARMLGGLAPLPVELVLATTQEGVASREFEVSLASQRDSLRIETCCTPPPKGVLRTGCHQLKQLLGAIRTVEPDHVYILMADGMWQLLSAMMAIGRRPWGVDLEVEAWLYRGGFTYRQGRHFTRKFSAWLKRKLFTRVLRQGLFAAMHLDDELMFDFAQKQVGCANRTKIVLTPNPIDLLPVMSMPQARLQMHLPLDGRLISMTGMINARKGALLLLDVFRRHRQRPGSAADRLLLGGPHHEQVKDLLTAPPYCHWVQQELILSRDTFLTGEQMFAYAAASNLTVAGYPQQSGRSSIILWAAAAGRPSLGTAWGCIGHVIEQQRLGLTCNVLDPQAYTDRLGEALNMPWTQQDSDRVREYARFHSLENYQRIATALLQERLGVGQAGPTL